MTFIHVDSSPKALIRLGVSCNNSCLFCHSKHGGGTGPDSGTAEVLKKIRYAARSGASMVVFSGGEPSIRKDIPDLCKYALKLGLKSGLITNGRMLFYKDFAERLVEAGVSYVLVSIHGADAETHNKLVMQDAYSQTMKGLENIARLPVRIVVNTVLTRLNGNTPERLAGVLEGIAPIHLKISLPEPRGAILARKDIVYSPQETTSLAHGIAHSLSRVKGITFGFDGFTPCLLEDYFSLNDDLFTHGFSMVSEPGDPQFYPPDHGDRSYLPSCGDCSVHHVCPGIYSRYLEWFPGTILPPVVKPVSNSIRFNLLSRHDLQPGENVCRLKIMNQPIPARRIAVKDGKNLLMYKTGEIETDDSELRRTKFEMEQVYRNVPDCIEDYPENLEKMRLSRRCTACTRFANCPGLFFPAGGRPHAAARKREAGLLELAKGRVLEIGCGSIPFSGHFKRMLIEKHISLYIGIDPDLQQSQYEGTSKNFLTVKTSLEDFRWTKKPFDTVFLFRSWHHLKDVGASMAAISSVTKRGSLLVITENCRHIELHDLPSAVAGAGCEPVFEHYRNHSPEQVATTIGRLGFEIVAIFPVERTASNHWAVVARRLH